MLGLVTWIVLSAASLLALVWMSIKQPRAPEAPARPESDPRMRR